MLLEKAEWVIARLGDWQARKAPTIVWANGERIPFRGEEFILLLAPKKRGSVAQLYGEVLHVPVGVDAEEAAIEKAVSHWYRIEALQVFRESAEHFAPILGVAPREIKLSTARTQWGSCTAQGVVRLNWQLVKMPLHLIDYVMVHELAHLRQMNHSPAFWSLVESVCVEYKQYRAELHGYGVAE